MDIAAELTGGDPRSLGKASQVTYRVLKDKSALPALFNCLFIDDETVRMRASDALEKVCRQNPQWFEPYVMRLLEDVPSIRQPSVQWHLAQMLSEISLTSAQTRQATAIMENNLNTMDDWIVTNLTLESLATFVRRGGIPKHKFLRIANRYLHDPHKSVSSRANKLLSEFSS